jgi:hypothetical protein
MKFNDYINERKSITLKRKYTENHPAMEVGMTAKVRNKVLTAISDGLVTQDEFDRILSELSGDSKRWLKRNARYFNVSEDGISLSKFGKRALDAISVNEDETVDEGKNAFITAARAAKANGQKEFEFNGKTFPVTVKDVSEEDESDEPTNEETQNTNNTMNEAIKVEGKRDAKKVFNALTKFFNVTAPALKDDGNNHLAAVKQMFLNGMEDANFSREREAVAKKMPRSKAFSPIMVEVEGLGGATAKVSASDLRALVDNNYGLVANAANYSGLGVVEGVALYIESLGYANEAQAMIDQFNMFFENNLVQESFEVFASRLNEEKELDAHSILNEAFSSNLLRDAFTNTSRWSNEKKVDARLATAFYQSTKIALDKVQDEDISVMDPQDAYKLEKGKKGYNYNKYIIYISDNEKENPYSDRGAYNTIPGGGFILAVSNANGDFMGISGWKGGGGLTKSSKGYRGVGSYGVDKKYKGYGATGLYNVKRIAEMADRALVFNVLALRDKYSTFDKTSARQDAKKGALAFTSDKEFRKENQNRYYDILKQRASETDTDTVVKEIVELINNAVSAGIAAGEAGQWGSIAIPGTKYSIGDASRTLANTLDLYGKYVDYNRRVAEWEAETGGKATNGTSYYKDEADATAKRINDIHKDVKGNYIPA